MLSPGPSQQIFLATEPVDMRGGFDRLASRVMQAGLDLYAGHLFVFLSKRRTHLKILTHDGTGLVVLYKRLSRSRFVLPEVSPGARTATLDAATLATLLAGLQVAGLQRSKSNVGPAASIDAVLAP
jgi:transposase